MRRKLNIFNFKSAYLPFLLLSIGAGKAFNCIHWMYMFQVWFCGSYSYSHFGHILIFICLGGTSPLMPIMESIRFPPKITGFTLQQKTHTNQLFNDVILLLINPIISLLSVYQTLSAFSSLSYYKLNFSLYMIKPVFG